MSLIEDSEFNDIYPFTFDEPNSQPLAETVVRTRRYNAASRTPARPGDLKWNVMTVLVWLLMAFTVMAFVSIHANPYTALNPFQPLGAPTLAAAVFIPTATAEAAATQATVLAPAAITTTPEPATATATITPTVTLMPTDTPTPGPSPTPTIHSLFPFMQRGETKAIDGASFHTSDECYLWVAGQAYDLQGAPMVGITVMLGGGLEYKTISQLSLTGTALQYGQAGYEFIITDHPVKSTEDMWVQLFDQAMIPLSNRVFFDTHDDCSQNLILINFRQVR